MTRKARETKAEAVRPGEAVGLVEEKGAAEATPHPRRAAAGSAVRRRAITP